MSRIGVEERAAWGFGRADSRRRRWWVRIPLVAAWVLLVFAEVRGVRRHWESGGGLWVLIAVARYLWPGRTSPVS
jgi:hypothetical protein